MEVQPDSCQKKKDLLNLYLYSDDYCISSWVKINQIIDDILKAMKKGGQNDLSNILPGFPLYAQDDFKEQDKEFEIPFEDYKNQRESFITYKRINLCVIVKITKPGDFSDFLYFLWCKRQKSTEVNIYLGFDVNEAQSQRMQDKLQFSLSRYWGLFRGREKASIKSPTDFFMSNYRYKNTTGPKKIIQQNVTSLIDKTKPRKFSEYSPLIKINKQSYELLFKKKVTNNCSDLQVFVLEKRFSFFMEQLRICREKIFIPPKNLKPRKLEQLRNRENRFDETIYNIQQKTKKQSVICRYLFALFLDCYLIEKSDTKKDNSKRPLKWAKALLEFRIEQIDSLILLVKRYTDGLEEIAENVIQHTSEKKGLLSITLRKGLKILSDDKGPIYSVGKGDYRGERKKYFQNYFSLESNRKTHFFLDISIVDFNKEGIVKTFKPHHGCEEMALPSLKLENFFSKNFDSFSEFSQLNLRYLAGIGLKSFANIVNSHMGYFQVETGSGEGKKERLSMTPFVDQGKVSSEPLECRITGTHYKILLPLSPELVTPRYDSSAFKYTTMSLAESLKTFLEKSKLKTVDVGNIHSVCRSREEEKSIVFGIEQLEKKWRRNHMPPLIPAFDFGQMTNIKRHSLLRIIAYLSINSNFETVIAVNIENDIVVDIIHDLKIFLNTSKFWSNHTSLYLFPKSGGFPLILHGENFHTTLLLNKMVDSLYGDSFIKELEEIRIDEVPLQNSLIPGIFRYDLLVKTHNRGRAELSLFEQEVLKILEKNLENEPYGLKLKFDKAHMQLGSKIHINHFYKAESLFRLSYYVDGFAFILAKDILEKFSCKDSRNKIALFGYDNYSTMLLKRLQDILNKTKEDFCPIYLQAVNNVETNRLEWTNSEGIEVVKNLIKSNKRVGIHVIVPIASTLSTNRKLIDLIDDAINKSGQNDNEYDLESYHYICNSVLVLVRDRSPVEKEEYYNDNVTGLEHFFGWKKMDLEKREINCSTMPGMVSYKCVVNGNWNHAAYCEKCFPNNAEEELLLQTDSSSVLPKLILGEPDIEFDSIGKYDSLFNEEENTRRIEKLNDCLKYGHIDKVVSHHLYLIDMEKLLHIQKTGINGIQSWLEKIKNEIYEQKYPIRLSDDLDIIVTNGNEESLPFVQLANDTIFGGIATVINLNIYAEFKDNIIKEYSHLKCVFRSN